MEKDAPVAATNHFVDMIPILTLLIVTHIYLAKHKPLLLSGLKSNAILRVLVLHRVQLLISLSQKSLSLHFSIFNFF